MQIKVMGGGIALAVALLTALLMGAFGIVEPREANAFSPVVMVGAGDISSGSNRDNQTGDQIRNQLANGAFAAFTAGDNAYPNGTLSNYNGNYHNAWGSFKGVTFPTLGNHEYGASTTAAGSVSYWRTGSAVTHNYTNSTSFYAYDIPNSLWTVVQLNSQKTEPPSNSAPPCGAGSAQRNFLINELNAANSAGRNVLLIWHHARFSRSTDHPTSEGSTGCSRTFYDIGFDLGADLVVQGHSHLIEAYHSRDKNGNRVTGGLTSLVCGTGGNSFDTIGSNQPSPDFIKTNTWGICQLTLTDTGVNHVYLENPNVGAGARTASDQSYQFTTPIRE
jgi:hypothetical protein